MGESLAFHLVSERERERDWPQRRSVAWITGASLVALVGSYCSGPTTVSRVVSGMQAESFKDTWHTYILDHGALDISILGFFSSFQPSILVGGAIPS